MSNAGTEEERRVYLASLAEMRANDLISADDETALARHYEDQKASLEAAFLQFLPEYQRRLREDGEASANAWLAETARELGRREGEAAGKVVGGLTATREATPG
ncbi:hypothetical protein [Dokdonella sp.]|uniref:hypothetical protein n=1 Tax=Dokdonella sp. TaxID=2291710 RepID=UPI001B280BCE|nr:hypothetical protein [Dokdonella sp.]MBO9661662.1 hypothetical protein [Dokdonella sp.]